MRKVTPIREFYACILSMLEQSKLIVEIFVKATLCDCNDFYTMQLSKFRIASSLNGWNELVLYAGLMRRPMSVI